MSASARLFVQLENRQCWAAPALPAQAFTGDGEASDDRAEEFHHDNPPWSVLVDLF
jgi:hypothetical protein